ncbi:MAG: hypothetical protein ACXIVF_09955 [Rhizobiaceae bacterium]
MRPEPATLVPQALLALAAFAWLVLLHLFGPVELERFIGAIPPPVMAVSLPVVAVASLWLLQKRAGLRFLAEDRAGRGIALAAFLATLFAVPPIIVDLAWGLASGPAVAVPVALAFYPVMAFVAETVFHLLPLALLIGVAGTRRGRDASVRSLWPFLIVVALIEPAYQTWLRLPLHAPMLVLVFVALHVLAFNLAQLWMFVRYGFAVMLAMRVVYYVWWHIAWGG